MKIPTGCVIDRNTGQRTMTYQEGTAEELAALAVRVIHATAVLRDVPNSEESSLAKRKEA